MLSPSRAHLARSAKINLNCLDSHEARSYHTPSMNFPIPSAFCFSKRSRTALSLNRNLFSFQNSILKICFCLSSVQYFNHARKPTKRGEIAQTKRYLHGNANYTMYTQKLRFMHENQLKQVNKCQLFTHKITII